MKKYLKDNNTEKKVKDLDKHKKKIKINNRNRNKCKYKEVLEKKKINNKYSMFQLIKRLKTIILLKSNNMSPTNLNSPKNLNMILFLKN